MKIKRIILLTAFVVLLFGLSAFAAGSELLFYDDFDSYSSSNIIIENGSPTKIVNSAGEKTWNVLRAEYAQLVSLGKGLSLKYKSPNSSTVAIIEHSFDANTFSATDSVGFGFSANFSATDGRQPHFVVYAKNGNKQENIIYTDAGVLKVGNNNVACGTLSRDIWYDFYVEYNIKTSFINLTISNSSGTVVHAVQGKADLGGLDAIQFANVRAGGPINHIDNVWITKLCYEVQSDGSYYKEAASTRYSTVDAAKNEYKFTFSENIDDASIPVDAVSFNGDTSNIDSVTASGKELTVRLKNPLEGEETYLIDIKNLPLSGGVSYSGSFVCLTKPLCKAENLSYGTITPGSMLSVSLDVSQDSTVISQAVVILALYDEASNRVIAVDFKNTALGLSPFTVTNSLTVPATGAYKAYVYIWDSISGMLSLHDAIEIK